MRNRLLLVGATLVAFGASLFGGFHFDDYAIFQDAALTTPEGLGQLFQLSRLEPAADLSFALNYLIGGQDPLGYHLVNLLLHLAAVVLALECLRALMPETAAVAGAALFALHPIQAEAVNYIWARSILLAMVLCLASLFLWLKGRRWIAVLPFGLALLAYPQCAAFPLLFALVHWSSTKQDRPPARMKILFPLGAMLILSSLALARLALFRPEAPGIPAYLAAQGPVVWRYLRLVIAPYGFTVDPDIRVPPLWVAALAWAALGITGWAAWRARRAGWPLWLLAGAVLLLPSSSIFPAPDMAADRRMYAPMFCFAAGGGLLLARLKHRELAGGIAVGLAATLCLFSLIRTQVWVSDQRLWEEAVRRAPEKTRPKIQLSRVLPAGKALELLQAAANNSPRDPEVAAEMGKVLLEERQVQAALNEFGRAVTLDPGNAQYFNNRGVALGVLGDTEGARADFRRALEIDPALSEARENLRRLPPEP